MMDVSNVPGGRVMDYALALGTLEKNMLFGGSNGVGGNSGPVGWTLTYEYPRYEPYWPVPVLYRM